MNDSTTQLGASSTSTDALLSGPPQQLAIFGATRGIGLQALQQALAAGHRVHVLVRDRARMTVESANLTVYEGDVNDAEAVRNTLQGCDAVLCCLGAPALSRSRVRSEGTQVIADVMAELGMRRILCVSLLGAGESRDGLPFFFRYLLFPTYLRRAVADHERQEAVLSQTALDWTVVRPPSLTDGPRTGRYDHGFHTGKPGLTMKISRPDVADFMLRQLNRNDYSRRGVGVSYCA